MGQALDDGLSAVSGFGGDLLKGAGAVGNEVMNLPGQIGGALGLGQGQPALNGGVSSTQSPVGTGSVGSTSIPGGAGANPISSTAAADTLSSLNGASTPPVSGINAPQIPAAPTTYGSDGGGFTMAPGAGTSTPTVTPAAPAGGIQSLIKNLMSPGALKTELPAALFGINAFNSMQPTSVEKDMKAQLANAKENQALTQNQLHTEQTGQLPPQLQAQIDQQKAQAEAAVRAHYAAMGMSGSSAEATDLAAAGQQAVSQGFTEAQQLVGQSSNLLGQFDQETNSYLQQLYQEQMQRDAQFGNSISGFLSALGYQQPAQTAAH